MKTGHQKPEANWRFFLVVLIVLALPIILLIKIASLQGSEFLRNQGDSRALRSQIIPAHRGIISDRHGVPLAVSTPVSTLTADPQLLLSASANQLMLLAEALGQSPKLLKQKLKAYRKKSFMYLSRQLPVEEADNVLDMKIPGVNAVQEYKRFYPAGEVAAQLVGITSKEQDRGQEGVELAYNAWLSGESGLRRVLQDKSGHVIEELEVERDARRGKPLSLSIDLRIQYAAYRALKTAVHEHDAAAGSIVVLDVKSGEVLAMVNQPSFNPNDRSTVSPNALRNRAMLDLIEPGSTVKPFTILTALQSGIFSKDSNVDTSPGYITVDYKTFTDINDYGVLNLTEILSKSSQVGTIKVALELDPSLTRGVFEKVGLGQSTGSGFPAEAVGNLPTFHNWDPISQATFAFGYGFSVTSLQLARAYSVLANDGIRREISLIADDPPLGEEKLFDPDDVRTVRGMLESVTGHRGTGQKASISGYSVAGKTGTLHKTRESGGYADNRYTATFAGIAPVARPRIVTVVVIDEPSRGKYFGGQVAAPVFAEVTGNALRLMRVTPDSASSMPILSGTKIKLFSAGES
ncbi:MAG: cell division protein [Porticoccaceae bacterium]|nr:cell division protein [Porticoccaceae bacterium]